MAVVWTSSGKQTTSSKAVGTGQGETGLQGPPGAGMRQWDQSDDPTEEDVEEEGWVPRDFVFRVTESAGGTPHEPGDPGPPGPGVPEGGEAGQVLTKDTEDNFDTSWQTPEGSGSISITDGVEVELDDVSEIRVRPGSLTDLGEGSAEIVLPTGIPYGGNPGEVLTKTSEDDYEAAWSVVPVDPRIGVRVAWENDSTMFTNTTSDQTTCTYTIPPLGGSNPGGNKWVFSTHGIAINNSGEPANLTLRCKVNGTGALVAREIEVPSDPNDRLVRVEWTLLADNDWNLNNMASFRVAGLYDQPLNTSPDLVNQMGYSRGNYVVQSTWDSPIVLTITKQWSSATNTSYEYHGHDVIYYPTTPG